MKVFVILACMAMALAAPASMTHAQNPLSYKQFLGKTLNDDAVASFIIQNNCTYGMGNYKCKSLGIELGVTMVKRQVRTVFMFRQGVEGYKQYRGEMPFGLKWTDNIAAVEARLGQPAQRYGDGAGGMTYAYRTRNLWIDFDGSARNAKIKRLQVQIPQ